jgi:hypothetical protein
MKLAFAMFKLIPKLYLYLKSFPSRIGIVYAIFTSKPYLRFPGIGLRVLLISKLDFGFILLRLLSY